MNSPIPFKSLTIRDIRTLIKALEIRREHGESTRVRIVTDCHPEIAEKYLKSQADYPCDFEYISWDSPLYWFAGRMEDFVVTSGLGSPEQMNNLRARMRIAPTQSVTVVH